jgi:NADPH2:quinone reductase
MGTQRDLARLVGLVGDGRLDPVTAGTYPLAETGEAFAAMKRGDAVGTLVVTP